MLTKHKHVYFFNVSTTNHVGEEGCELLKVGVGVLHPLPVDGRDVDEEVSDGGHRGAVLLYSIHPPTFTKQKRRKMVATEK